MTCAHYLIIATFAIRASHAFTWPWPLPTLRWPTPEAAVARTKFEPLPYSLSRGSDPSARISNLQLLTPIFVSDLDKSKHRQKGRTMLYEPMLPLVERDPAKSTVEYEPMLPLVEKTPLLPLGEENSLVSLPGRNPIEKPLVHRKPLPIGKESMLPSWLKKLPLCCHKHLTQAQLFRQSLPQNLESPADDINPLSERDPVEEEPRLPLERDHPILIEKEPLLKSWVKHLPMCCHKHASLALKQLFLQPSSQNLENPADDSKVTPKADVLIQYDGDDDDDDYEDDDYDSQRKNHGSSAESKSIESIEPEVVKRTVSVQSAVNVIPKKNEEETLERLRTVCAQFSLNANGQRVSKDEPVGSRLIPGLVSALCKILLKESGYVVPEIREENMYRYRPQVESWEGL